MNFELMKLKTLGHAPVQGKRVLLRVAYDITLEKRDGKYIVPDDARIRATLPTIRYLLDKGCSLVLMSYLGRPKAGVIEERYKMDPIAEHLQKLLGTRVQKLDATVGEPVRKKVADMHSGDIILLENTRFNQGEQEADPVLAREMASLAEFVVYDAFGQAHRVHASTTGILEEHKNTCCAGFLMERELTVFEQIIKNPMKPFVVVLGGVKISDKLGMMRAILGRAQMVLIGGALSNTFFKARGLDVGGSLAEGTYVNQAKGEREDPISAAQGIIKLGEAREVPQELVLENWPDRNPRKLSYLQLPFDVVVGRKREDGGIDTETLMIKQVNGQALCGASESLLDIGPVTRFVYGEIIKRARTIFWNGPMGLFEDFYFAEGTRAVAEAIAASKGFSVVGGGDTESVVSLFHLEGRFGHVSTGGGASLELLAGEELPVVKYLKE